VLSIIQIPQEPSRAAITASEYEGLSVVTQFKRSFSEGNRLGLLIGMCIGSFVPLASYVIVHYEVITSPWMWVLVFAALLFSATSVFNWAQAAFHSGIKGAGFCVLTEGVMVLSHTEWLALAALALLVIINVCSCSCALQVGKQADPDASMPVVPSVTVNVQQNNVTTPASPRQSTGRTDEERKAADARRARQYRARRKRDAIASLSV